jgi:hypothetical protein
MTSERVESLKEGLKPVCMLSPESTRLPRLMAAGLAMSSTEAVAETNATGATKLVGSARTKGLLTSTGPSIIISSTELTEGVVIGASCSYRSLVTVKTMLLFVVVCSWRRPAGAFTRVAEATVTEQVVRCPLQTAASAAARACSSVCALLTSPVMDTDTALRIISVALKTDEFLSAGLRADSIRL